MSLNDRLKTIKDTCENKMFSLNKCLTEINFTKLKSSANNFKYEDYFNFDLNKQLFDWDLEHKSPFLVQNSQNPKILYANSNTTNK